jgi:hypothetical protein
MLRLLYSKLAQMGNLSCLTMVTWPLAGTLYMSLARLRKQGTMIVLAFCFRRWHSVHDVVALLSFWVCIARNKRRGVVEDVRVEKQQFLDVCRMLLGRSSL